jgi:signal transduction histidine kinase
MEAQRMEQGPNIARLNGSDKVKILVVDDQPAKLLSYEIVLAGIGETLIKASSACEAFECLLKNDIGLILIDVCMPDIDGFELAALIREHPRFQRIAIIFVSTAIEADLHQLRGYNLGAVDYIPVPVVPELLCAKVKVFVELYRKTRQLEQFNAELEQRVLERTADLRRCNAQLEERVEQRTREREAALAQLFEAQQMETMGRLAGVAHDFNNLLMAVLGSLTLLERHVPEDPECRRWLYNATQAALRGKALTQCLLTFSRRRERKPESVNIADLVSGMKELLKRALGLDIELHCRFPRTLPPVFVDANQLELALLNIALNACAAMPGGGRFMISALKETKDFGGPDSSPPPGDYVCIRFVNTGMRMDDVVRAMATEPSFTTKGSGGEPGLGLSVVHRMAAQSGGLFRIVSAPNVGSSFELWLPRADTLPVSLGREIDIFGTRRNLNW